MSQNGRKDEADALTRRWRDDARWNGIERSYSAGDVMRLRGSVRIEHTLARRGAEVIGGRSRVVSGRMRTPAHVN